MTTETPNRVQSYDKLLIGSKWIDPSTDSVIKVISDHRRAARDHPEARQADVDAAVAAARKAFDEGPWPRMTPVDRAAILSRVGDEIKRRGTEIAATSIEKLGAPARIAAFIQQAAVDIWDETLTIPELFEFEQERTWTGGHGRVVHEPVGVVAAIIPWNGPLAAGALKIAPALIAGCTVVPGPNVNLMRGFVDEQTLTEGAGQCGGRDARARARRIGPDTQSADCAVGGKEGAES
jgi:aldehyde dehydrogenase (NAD+)